MNAQILEITVRDKLGYLPGNCAYTYLNAIPISEQAYDVLSYLSMDLGGFGKRR
jgi:hypothetical protein